MPVITDTPRSNSLRAPGPVHDTIQASKADHPDPALAMAIAAGVKIGMRLRETPINPSRRARIETLVSGRH
jgi:hypothetical protein